MKSLAKKYKSFDNIKLYKIIQGGDDYIPEAIEAAKQEITDRNLSTEELNDIREALLEERFIEKEKEEKILAAENNVQNIGNSILALFMPNKDGVIPASNKIILITVYLTIEWIYSSVSTFGGLKYYVQAEAYFEITLFVISILLTPIILFLFWKRKKIGWIFIFANMILGLLFTIPFFIKSCIWHIENFNLSTEELGVFSFLIGFGKPTHPLILLYPIIVYSIILWLISKKDVRSLFFQNPSS